MDYSGENYMKKSSFFNLINKRPRLLNILLLLSSIYLLSTLTAVTQRLIEGPMTNIQLEEKLSTIYGSSSTIIDQGNNKEFIKSKELIVKNSIYVNNEIFYLSNITLLGTIIVGLIAVFLMFFRIKMGLLIYIIYSILPIATMYLTTPSDLILNIPLIILAISGLILITLYTKALRKVEVKQLQKR